MKQDVNICGTVHTVLEDMSPVERKLIQLHLGGREGARGEEGDEREGRKGGQEMGREN